MAELEKEEKERITLISGVAMDRRWRYGIEFGEDGRGSRFRMKTLERAETKRWYRFDFNLGLGGDKGCY